MQSKEMKTPQVTRIIALNPINFDEDISHKSPVNIEKTVLGIASSKTQTQTIKGKINIGLTPKTLNKWGVFCSENKTSSSK